MAGLAAHTNGGKVAPRPIFRGGKAVPRPTNVGSLLPIEGVLLNPPLIPSSPPRTDANPERQRRLLEKEEGTRVMPQAGAGPTKKESGLSKPCRAPARAGGKGAGVRRG